MDETNFESREEKTGNLFRVSLHDLDARSRLLFFRSEIEHETAFPQRYGAVAGGTTDRYDEGHLIETRLGNDPPYREGIPSVANSVLKIGIHGATGRMGTRLIQLIAADPTLALGAAIDRAAHPRLGEDAGSLAGVGSLGVPLSKQLDPAAKLDAMIDFSLPQGTLSLVEPCRAGGFALVVGTTGFEPAQKERVEVASDRIPILISANFSKAVNLLMKLAGEAARVLGDAADIEIVERHHHFKKDAPSGTALRIAEVIGQAIGTGPEHYAHGRHGVTGDRPRGEIGLHALRTGDNPGEHTVIFGLMGECLELSHRALNRDGFARGALDAAKFLAGKPPRIYTMADLLE